MLRTCSTVFAVALAVVLLACGDTSSPPPPSNNANANANHNANANANANVNGNGNQNENNNNNNNNGNSNDNGNTNQNANQNANQNGNLQGNVIRVAERTTTGALAGIAGIHVHRSDAATGAYIDTRVTDADGIAHFEDVTAARSSFSIVRPPAAGSDEPTHVMSFVGIPAGPLTVRLDELPGPHTPLAAVDVAADPTAPSWAMGVMLPTRSPGYGSEPGAVPIYHADLQDDGTVTMVVRVGGGELGQLRCGARLDQPVPADGSTVTVAVDGSPSGVPFHADASVLITMSAVRKGVTFNEQRLDSAYASGTVSTCLGELPGVERYLLRARTGGAYVVTNEGYDLVTTTLGSGQVQSLGAMLEQSVELTTTGLTLSALTYDGALHATLAGPLAGDADIALADLTWTSGSASYAWHLVGAAGVALAPPQVPDVTAPAWGSGVAAFYQAYAVEGANGFDAVWSALRDGRGPDQAFGATAAATAHGQLERRTPNYVVGFDGYTWERYGTIRSSDGQINCGGSCTGDYPAGTSAHLTATPNSGAVFNGWGGECASYGNATAIDLPLTDHNVTCNPSFGPDGSAMYSLSVANASPWTAVIRSDDGWIYCGDDLQGHHDQCWNSYASGYAVKLSVQHGGVEVYDFHWLDGCSGDGPSTEVVMDHSISCSVELVPH